MNVPRVVNFSRTSPCSSQSHNPMWWFRSAWFIREYRCIVLVRSCHCPAWRSSRSFACDMQHKEGSAFKKSKKISKLLFVLAGHVSLGMGLIGIVVPLLPTTPCLLLAAACYIRGSENLYNWLIHQRFLGPYIASYREGRGIPLKLKFTLIALIWFMISLSAFTLLQQIHVRLILFAIAIAISAIIWRLPTNRQAVRSDGNAK